METLSSRLVIAQFCDDIRHEIGGKFSLVGCYGGEMIIDKLPIVLPKLCAQISVFTPFERPFGLLLLRANLNGDTLAEIEMPTREMKESIQKKKLKSELGRLSAMALMVFSPLPVNEPCKLRIEAETEDGIILGSFLTIRERTLDDPPMK
jgi:hypothetical protein